MFYLTTHSTHFIYGYMASDIRLKTILIVRKETWPPHRLLLSINSKGSFICTIPQTGQCRRYPTAVNIPYYTQHSVHYPGFCIPNHLVVNQNYSQNTVSIIFQSYFHLTPVLQLCVFAIKHTFKGEKKALQI